MQEENEDLTADNRELRRQLRALAAVEEENKELRRSLQMRDKVPEDMIAAEISGVEQSPFFRVVKLTIDRGSGYVRPGMAVITDAGVVGRIDRADEPTPTSCSSPTRAPRSPSRSPAPAPPASSSASTRTPAPSTSPPTSPPRSATSSRPPASTSCSPRPPRRPGRRGRGRRRRPTARPRRPRRPLRPPRHGLGRARLRSSPRPRRRRPANPRWPPAGLGPHGWALVRRAWRAASSADGPRMLLIATSCSAGSCSPAWPASATASA
jgi:hypothetical protein